MVTGPRQRDGLKYLLALSSDDLSLAVVGEIAADSMPADRIAASLSIPESKVRDVLSRLVSAGIAGYSDSDEGQKYFLNRTTAAIITDTLVDLFTPGANMTAYQAAKNGSDPRRLAVPEAPSACLVCNNTGFVTGVLGDLEDLLSESNRYQLKLQALSSEVIAAQEAERKRISRELHDDTAQALTSLLVRLRLLERTARDAGVSENVEELRELTSNALENVRRLAMDLRPAALDDLGLAPALESFVERFSERWQIDAGFEVRGLKSRLPPEIELALYRVAQEALNNVAKHSGASRVEVRLTRSRREVTLVVRDDGRGFDGERVRHGPEGGLGLFGIGERLSLVGGTVEVDTGPAKGTTVTVRVPAGRLRRQRS
jgi:two-component system sensor histidine kinase NreB